VFFLEELADKRWKRVLAGIGAAGTLRSMNAS
jgi:hypothetical protein